MSERYLNLYKELQDVISDEFKQEINEIISTQNIHSNAEFILQLCKIITKKIDIYVYTQSIYGTQTSLYGNRSKNKGTKEEQDLMIFATQLIYAIRSFIQEEEIFYHMVSKDENGKQIDAFISQKQIMNSLTGVTKKSIGVTREIQKQLIQKNQSPIENARKNMWQRVEYLSEGLYLPGRNIKKIDMRKSGERKAHWAYQNQKKDILIYLKYSGGKKRILTKYYDKEESGKKDSLMSFNNGWLWEWYNEILYGESDEQYEAVKKDLLQGTLKSIMSTPDYIPGTKQGDFQDAIGRQIQSKYYNEKIISYNNIRHIIFDLEQALTLYLSENSKENVTQNLINKLQEHFYPESAKLGDDFANNEVKKLMSKLEQSIKSS